MPRAQSASLQFLPRTLFKVATVGTACCWRPAVWALLLAH